jgi:hypothetical protein
LIRELWEAQQALEKGRKPQGPEREWLLAVETIFSLGE